MIKQRKCVYHDVIYVSRTSQSTCAAQLITLLETETVFFLSYLLSITTEKFGYSLSRKTYRDRNTRWNTRNMTASTIDGLEKKKQQTAKQTKTI